VECQEEMVDLEEKKVCKSGIASYRSDAVWFLKPRMYLTKPRMYIRGRLD
jgi:hypothetical protein